MPVPHWTCPACTLFRGQRCILNSAPYRPASAKDKESQGTDHLCGRKHKQAMKHVGPFLLSPKGMTEFFSYIEGPKPTIETEIEAIKALKDYIAECGGDPEMTIVTFAPPPPPVPPEMERRSTIKCVTRSIASPTYATYWGANGVVWTQLLCCWDDPIQARVEQTNTPTPRIPPDTLTTGAAAVRVPAGRGYSIAPRIPPGLLYAMGNR